MRRTIPPALVSVLISALALPLTVANCETIVDQRSFAEQPTFALAHEVLQSRVRYVPDVFSVSDEPVTATSQVTPLSAEIRC